MTLMAAGYFPDNYWPSNYWPHAYPYWPSHGAVVITITITNPVPTDASTTGTAFFASLSVDVTDSGGSSMNVTFYDASDDSTIGIDMDVASGGTATILWEGLTKDTEYEWYVIAANGTILKSDTWSFTTSATNETYIVWDSGNEILKTFVDGTEIANLTHDAVTFFKYLSANGANVDGSLTVTGNASQTENLQDWKNNAGDTVAQLLISGRFFTTGGVGADAPVGSASLVLYRSSGVEIDHVVTNAAGNFDLTGGSSENLFSDTTNSLFTQADADDDNWIVITSGTYLGAMAQVDEYIDASNVTLHSMGWTFDLTAVDYIIIKHPQVVIGDGGHTEFQVGSQGHFDIHGQNWLSNEYSQFMFEVEMSAGMAAVDCGFFKAEANGYGSVQALVTDYESGDVGPGESGGAVASRIDVAGATSADSTTEIINYLAVLINGTAATTTAYKANVGYENAFVVQGADAIDPSYGYDVDVSLSTVTDRVTGVAPTGTAFLISSATDVTLFSEYLDYILIGHSSPFEIIEYTAATGASKNIVPVFEYSTGSGTWSTLTPSADGTVGFTQSGQISFTAPGGWAVGDEAEAPADITSAYYIRIARTRLAVMAVLPVEAHFKIYLDKDLGMKIRGDGTIQPVSRADTDAPNNSIYYSTTQSKLVYKDPGGTVNNLY